MKHFRSFGLAVLALGALLVPGLRADDEDANSAQAARAVRLSYVDGDVHLFQGTQVLTDQAVANTPLFEGTRIETGDNGRAEIQFEDGSVARVSPDSSLTLSILQGLSASSERNAELQVNSGLCYFELQGESDQNHMRVRFGDNVVTASGFTVIRVDVDNPPGEVAVFSGNAHLEAGVGTSLDLHGGESVALNASDPGNYNLSENIEPNSWDAWNSDRDQDLANEAANRTQATESQPDNQNPAWSDLDANGNWYNVPDQGYVWSPYDASNPGWDPYGNGYWMNSPGYGYMWVSGYPWGYLPYSCGAWNWYSSFGWGWAPGMCSPWWGGYGGWGFNIGMAPPRYRYPIRPRRWNPRPMEGTPKALIAVNRRPQPPLGTRLAPRDKTGTVLIGGSPVNPLRPIQPRRPYNGPGTPGNGFRQGVNNPGSSGPARPVFGGNAPQPIGVPARPVFNGNAPRPVGVPAQPGGNYRTPPRGTYAPPPAAARPSGGNYHPPAASRPSAPSHSGGGGGGRPMGGGGGRPSGGGGGGHPAGGGVHR
jgi:hypothetical protein